MNQLCALVSIAIAMMLSIFMGISAHAATFSLEKLALEADYLKIWTSNRIGTTVTPEDENVFHGPLGGGFCQIIALDGRIRAQDADRFRQFLSDNNLLNAYDREPTADEKQPGSSCESVPNAGRDTSIPRTAILLRSEGGSFKEAIEIAKIVAENAFTTIVPAWSTCKSACAVIFMAGTYKRNLLVAPSYVSRWLHVSATLGFHAPFPRYGGTQMFTAENARDIYGVGAKQIVDYAEFIRLGTRRDHTSLILNETSPDRYMFVDEFRDAMAWNVDVFGYTAPSDGKTLSFAANACVSAWGLHDWGPIDDTGLFLEATQEASTTPDLSDEEILPMRSRGEYELDIDSDEVFGVVGQDGHAKIAFLVGHARWPHEIECSLNTKTMGEVADSAVMFSDLLIAYESSFTDRRTLSIPYWFGHGLSNPLKSGLARQ